MKTFTSTIALVGLLTVAPIMAAADGPLRLDLDTPIELNSFTYSSRQLYNAGERPVEVLVELVAVTPHWFGDAHPLGKVLAPGETLALSAASGMMPPGEYQGTLRIRVIEQGADWPPLDGESWRSPEERERLEANVIQTLSIPVSFAAEQIAIQQ